MHRRTFAIAAAFAVLAAASPASADQNDKLWRAGPVVDFLVLGGGRPTGGVAPGAEIAHTFKSWDRLSLSLGGRLVAFNLSSFYWLGIVGDGHLGLDIRATNSIGISLQAGASAFKIPICSDIGECGRAVGLSPSASVETSWTAPGGVAVATGMRFLYVETPLWSGPSFGAFVKGTYGW